MSYQIGELILFHDADGNVDDTAIVLGSRKVEHSEHYYPIHANTELIYKIHLTDDGRVIEYPEHHLRLRASSRKEYEAKYGK